MATFTGTAANETITPSTVSAAVTRDPLGSLPSTAADTIYGNGGVDTLDGGGGNDTIYGGTGHDTIFNGLGDDYMDAGLGTDTVSYANATASVIVDLSLMTAQNTIGGGTDTLLNFENVLGSGLNDSIVGTVGNNILNGAAGTDRVSYVNATAGVTVNLGLAGAQNTGGAGTDTLVSIEELIGSNFSDVHTGDGLSNAIFSMGGNDVLSGLAGGDLLAGGDGHDTLNGGDGNDSLIGDAGNDILNGGAGLDIASYGDATAGVTVNLSNGAAQNTGGAGTDTLILGTIENLLGSMHNDVLIGDGADNVLIGLGGDDALSGGNGNDLLLDGVGDDILTGGSGQDTASYGTATGDVAVDLTIRVAQNTMGAGIDTLVSIENLSGSDFGDVLTGDGADNVLSGWIGNDVLNGGRGNDTLIGGVGDDQLNGGIGTDTAFYTDRTVGVTVNLGLAAAQNTVGAGLDTLVNMENLTGSNFNDTLTGNSGNNVIEGLAGNDVLNGGGGTDTASYNTTLTGVTVSLLLAGAQNTVGAGTDTLSNFENLKGSNYNDTLTGNTGSNVLIGGLGNDLLNGNTGTDTASYETATAGVTVSLLLAGAQNTVSAGSDTLRNFENLKGSNFSDSLTGNAGNNVLSGLAGNDALNGGAGNDLVYGGAGRDTLNGGVGNDTYDYNAVSESPAGLGKDAIIGFAGAGAAIGDRINLTTIDANSLAAGNQAFIWGGSFTAGHLRYVGGVLQGNTDADVAAEFEIQLVGIPALVVGGAGTDILL